MMKPAAYSKLFIPIALVLVAFTSYYLFFASDENRIKSCLLCDEANERNEQFEDWIKSFF